MKHLPSVLVALALLVAGIAALGPAAAQSQGPIEVTVTLDEFSVDMSTTTLPANTPIVFVITNAGEFVHEAVLEPAGAIDQPFEENGQPTEVEDIQPGQTVEVTWTIPEAGEFQIACHIGRHYENGMVQLFTASAAGAQETPAPASPTVAATAVASPTVAATTAVSPTAEVQVAATPGTLPVTGGTGDLPVGLLVAGLGILAAAAGLLLRRRIA